MAIPFLNNINLSDNQLQNAKLHITGTAPTAAAGQIYFDSSDTIAKYYSNATDTWISLVQTDFANGTYVSLTNGGTSVKRAYTVDLSAINGTSTAASRFLTKDNTWATVPQGDVTEVQGGTYITVTDQTGPVPIVNHDLTTRTDNTSSSSPGYSGTFTVVDSVSTNTTGHVTGLNVKTVTMPSAESYAFGVGADTGTDLEIASGDTLDISGGTNIGTTVGTDPTSGNPTIVVNLDDSIDLAGELTVSGTGQSSIAGQLTIPQVPSAGTDAASKHYVDQAVTGALSYQGGYDAATNTPNLDNSPNPNPIEIGWTYTVTVDGLFFTEQVRVGDVLIAEVSQPTALADWTTVQNNIDLATATTVGLGNVVPGTGGTITAPYTAGTATLDVVNSSASQRGAVIVAESDPIEVSYTSGIATVGIKDSTGTQKGALRVLTSSGTFYDGLIIQSYGGGAVTLGLDIHGLPNVNTTSSSSKVAIHDYDADNNKSMSLSNFFALASGFISKTGTITAGSLSGTVNHTWGLNTIVQTIDSSGNTVHCDISRTGTAGNASTAVATIATAQATDITILVQKIG